MRLFLLFLGLCSGILSPHSLQAETTPGQDLYQAAQLAFSVAQSNRQPQAVQYSATEKLFTRFLKHFPEHPESTQALYFIAVCQQKQGDEKAMLTSFKKLLEAKKTGPLAGMAAYQVGAQHFSQSQYSPALPLLILATKELPDGPIQKKSLYLVAHSQMKLQQEDEALKSWNTIAQDPTHSHRLEASYQLAKSYQKQDRSTKALAYYEKVLKSSQASADLKAESLYQSALLHQKEENYSEAAQRFQKAATLPELQSIQVFCQLGELECLAISAPPTKVIEKCLTLGKQKDQNIELRRLALKAEAHQNLNDQKSAVTCYQQIYFLSPHTQPGYEAGVVALFYAGQERDPDFLPQATKFLKKHRTQTQNDPRITSIRYLAGTLLFEKKQFQNAARSFEKMNLDHLDSELVPDYLYQLTMSYASLGKWKKCLKNANAFLDKQPSSERAEYILYKRAESHRELNQDEAAEEDFLLVVKQSKKHQLRQSAFEQLGVIYQKSNRYEALTKTMAQLLTEYPERSALERAQNHFWTGWAHLKQEQYLLAIRSLTKARSLQAPQQKEITLYLSLAHYQEKDAENLKAEVDLLIQSQMASQLPSQVFTWLGAELSKRNQPIEAWTYLSRGMNPQKPGSDRSAPLWRAYTVAALSHSQTRKAQAAAKLLLSLENHPWRKAEAYYLQGQAYDQAGLYADAQKALETGLSLKPSGKLPSQMRLLLAKIAALEGDYETASQHYVVVIELLAASPEIRKQALLEAAATLKNSSSIDHQELAERYLSLVK